MAISRRSALARVAAFGLASFATTGVAFAVTSYRYDSLGRLRVVTFDNGTVVHYIYDAAGNRTDVVRSPSGTFSATIPITGTAPVNLRTLANTAGYDGAQDATIAFTLGSAITITGAAGSGAPAAGAGIDTGDWPDPAFTTLALSLTVDGIVYGGGGHGAKAAGIGPAILAGPGGDAIYCRTPISITVSATGQLKGGGGGGGGGLGWRNNNLEIDVIGGGGGGGFPNGVGGAGANSGSNGTTSGGGAGGASDPPSGTHVAGAGGAGGGAAANGVDGGTGSGSGGSGWTPKLATAGALAGYAVRKNSNAVSVTNNGTISGTVG